MEKITESENPELEYDDILRAAKARLAYLAECGVTHIPTSVGGDRVSRALAGLSARVAACTCCPLSKERKNPILPRGSARSGVMFVSGPPTPTNEEDESGVTLSGEPGALLERIIRSMELEPEDVYISSVVRCRGEGGRGPASPEYESCSAYLKEEIDLINPLVIITLGAEAAAVIPEFNREADFADLRGRFHELDGVPVRPTYHPSELLEKPELKKLAWEDIKAVIVRLKNGE